jgi:hypothetical protein
VVNWKAKEKEKRRNTFIINLNCFFFFVFVYCIPLSSCPIPVSIFLAFFYSIYLHREMHSLLSFLFLFFKLYICVCVCVAILSLISPFTKKYRREKSASNIKIHRASYDTNVKILINFGKIIYSPQFIARLVHHPPFQLFELYLFFIFFYANDRSLFKVGRRDEKIHIFC